MKILLAVFAVLVFAVPAMAVDLTGSTVNLVSPLGDWEDGTFDVVFEVVNASPDNEWLSIVQIDFLDCVTVNSGSWDEACLFGDWFATPSGNSVVFSESDYPNCCGFQGVCTGIYTINITVDCEGDLDNVIFWALTGDNWGGDPHYTEGVITGPVGNEVSTWGSLKTLYR